MATTHDHPTTALPPPSPNRRRHVVPGRVGLVVTGSMAAGLVGAAAIVVGPAAGAREHVITGSLLLSFAAGWALLALLSRRTPHPQRWAAVPAATMAVTGLGVLALAPSGNTNGWIWPPAAAGLVAWIVVQSRRHLHSRSRPVVIYPVCAALALSAVGGAYETVREATDHTRDAAPGRLVDVGDHRLHIDCAGSGRPTVVLEPGLGEPSTAMAWIARGVAHTSRVCVYDRAGRGWSDSASTPQDGAAVATDLHTLLDRAGEPGPYVLAGHSAGGLYVLNFARLYPDQTAGVVLLDSMHPDQYERIPAWPAFYETFRRASAVLPTLARLGIGRVTAQLAHDDLPQPELDQQRALASTPRHYRSLRDEFSELRTAMRQAAQLTSLGDRPLVIVTAQKGAQDGWAAAQDDLATLSTNVEHRELPDATHGMVVEDERTAAVATDAIADAVEAVRSGHCLAGAASSSCGDRG